MAKEAKCTSLRMFTKAFSYPLLYLLSHIRIRKGSMYCNVLPYCDHNTHAPIISFTKLTMDTFILLNETLAYHSYMPEI